MTGCLASRRRRAPRLGSGPTAAVAAAALAMAWTVAASRCRCSAQTAPAPTARPSVIVVPFNSEGRDPRGYWLREASAVILTDDLVSLGVSAMSRDERLSRVRVSSRARGRQPQSCDGHPRGPDRRRAPRDHRVLRRSAATRLPCARDRFCSRAGRSRPRSSRRGPLAELFDVYGRIARRLAERPAARDDQRARPATHRSPPSSSTSRDCWPRRRR